MKVAVVKEAGPAERRVALVPEAVAKLRAGGHEVLVQTGAGAGAFFPDDSYSEAGASVVSADQLAGADAVLMVGPPDAGQLDRLRSGQVVLGMFAPLADPDLASSLAKTGATAVSLDLIPRTLSRAQPMDALTSQANIAGYKAAVLAAATFGRFFPLLITAAGTARPAKVLDSGHRCRGTAGHRDRSAPWSGGQRLRRQAGDQDRSRVARRYVHRADIGRRGKRRRRLCPRTNRRRTRGPAGGAIRSHRASRHRHHDGSGAWPPSAAAGHLRGAEVDGTWFGARRHGCEPARRQRRGLGSRRDNGRRERHHDHRRRQPALNAWPPRLRRCTHATSAPCCSTWSRTANSPST